MKLIKRMDNRFRHCIVSEEEFFKKLHVNEDYDFLSIHKKQYYGFLHVTPSKNKENIMKHGLLVDYSNKDVHLGEGVYGVNISFDIPTDVLSYYIYNFKVFLSNAFVDNQNLELTLFIGHQLADTEFCIYGEDNHDGFLVFKENIVPESLIYSVTLNKENYNQLFSLENIKVYQEKLEEDSLKQMS